jgi:hypothetical protein
VKHVHNYCNIASELSLKAVSHLITVYLSGHIVL